ncbi:MAG: small multi-drug export protein [Clostridiales bacterium]|nr:small multi-drug export protein [Clostridiales bacterium]
MDAIVENIANAMNNSLGAPLAVLLLSIIPIAEARFAIPFGISMGLSPIEAFGWAFLGSSLIAPILLIVFIPLINALSKTKLFSKIGKFLYDKFEKKSRSLADSVQSDAQSKGAKKPFITKSDMKKMGGTALFVAIPLPLTGVWTGSAVASILKIGFVKSLIGVIVGNAVACGIITLISFLFRDYVNYITLAFFAIAVIVVIILIVKFFLYKPTEQTDKNE